MRKVFFYKDKNFFINNQNMDWQFVVPVVRQMNENLVEMFLAGYNICLNPPVNGVLIINECEFMVSYS